MKLNYLLIIGLILLSSCNQNQNVIHETETNEIKKTVHNSEVNEFWLSLQSLCGKTFEGKLVLPENDEDFGGKRLVMHIRSCEEKLIKIPFFVGDDRSRTWVLTMANSRIELKHDHRHEDGSEDEITMYGGTSTNAGQAGLQIFPADEATKLMIPAASSNVWWITINEKEYTYNLRRLGTDRVFRVVFDLTKEVATPEAPWGWED